jgi:hypothetical protein
MAYTYQADVWCDACGEAIKADIAREHPAIVPRDPDDEHTFDSNDYPKHYDPESEESDSPENCVSGSTCLSNIGAGYGVFLENQLTQEGYRYLKTMLDEHGEVLPPHAAEWANHYCFSFHRNPYAHANDWLLQTIAGHAAEIQDRDGGNNHASALVSLANELARNLDGDTIQDLFQSDMDDDEYFRGTGWYSDEMDETEN